MKMKRVRYKSFDQTTFEDILIYSKLPEHPFWSHIETKIDFSFADRLCEVLYTGLGQYPYAPSLKLKIHLIQTYYNLSDRGTEEKIIGDLFIKRFLGLPVDFVDFDHSTIGLDRERLGTSLFMACHVHILAQMCSLGLWGSKSEKWIIDSFPSTAPVVIKGAYRLIQQAMIRIMQQLKRSYPSLHQVVSDTVLLDTMTHRLSIDSPRDEMLVAFSKLVAQAYGLLHSFTNKRIATLFAEWSSEKGKQRSLELQAVLRQVLVENSKPYEQGPEQPQQEPVGPDSDPVLSSDVSTNGPETESLKYEKIPRKDRPAHRIISAHDPDARVGVKTKFKMIKGYKIQNVCTPGGVILYPKAISASEHDRDAMIGMVQGIQKIFGITPPAVLGDTLYGHGKQREEIHLLGTKVIAPVPPSINPKGMYGNERFTYDRENDVYTCPGQKESIKKNYNSQLEGSQYHFGKANCAPCPLAAECTTNQKGRTIFHNDYFDIYEQATLVNESEEGKVTHKQRFVVERKNNEMKNHAGLGKPRTRGLDELDIKAKLAAMVVNLKHTVRSLVAPKPGFLRHPRKMAIQT